MDEIFAALLLADKTPMTFAERVVGLVVLVVSLASLIALIIYFAQRQRRSYLEHFDEQSRKSDEYAASYQAHQQRVEELLTRIADTLERLPNSK